MQNLHPIVLSVASGTLGASIGLVAVVVNRIIFGKRGEHEAFESERRTKLRLVSGLYRRFEPLVDELARLFSEGRMPSTQLSHCLTLTTNKAPWTAAEFMAVKSIEAAMIGFAIFVFVFVLGGPVLAIVMAGGTAIAYPKLAENSVVNSANARLKTLKLRLPFAIDQISLMMEAGAGFEDSLRTVVADNQDHPLSVEFAEVLRQMSLGRPRSQALAGFRDRMADDDVSEIVFAIIKGEELGTPLSNILREQAGQMRLKRSQWGEKAASEAEVQMVFPGMVTMIACLLVIVAPILLPVVIALLES